MHLKFYLPYDLLATHKKSFLTSEHKGGPVQGENAGSGSGAGDAYVAEE